MHTLIVVSHPVANSLTHAMAKKIADSVRLSSPENTVEVADLAAEGFDPRFGEADIAAFQNKAELTPEIIAEQTRIDRADALVLVYPIYWWSMPGQLKGWIDRVFTNGWAYDDSGDGKVGKKLQHLNVHLVAIGGADQRTFARHGYFGAMKTQIDHGIFDYCGAPVITSELVIAAEPIDADAHFATAQALGRKIFATRQHKEIAA